MIEKVYKLTMTDDKLVEKVIIDDNLNYVHMVFNKNEGLAEHHANSTVYMTVLRGTLSIGLDDCEIHEYDKGTILQIPFTTKMKVGNRHDEVLELIVVKAPAPEK